MKKFHFTVFIGRFQPFHNGHLRVIMQGLQHSEQMVVLCGSSFLPLTYRNPWSFVDRKAMIPAALDAHAAARVKVLPLPDSPYNESIWIQSVQKLVGDAVQACLAATPEIALIGHCRDDSGYVVNMFPQWQSIEVDTLPGIDGAAIRSQYFANHDNFEQFIEGVASQIPTGTREFLAEYYQQDAYNNIFEEHQFVLQFARAWATAPYPPVFVTVDAVVVQAGHVLLVERRAAPGKGLMALPGGFIDLEETLLHACIRELQEETMLKLPDAVLRGALKRSQTFDAPYRAG